MMNTIEAIIKNGMIVPIEPVDLNEGSRALVTILESDDEDFWLLASGNTADAIWDNDEDDVYAELLA